MEKTNWNKGLGTRGADRLLVARVFRGVALAGALLCLAPNASAQQATGPVSALARSACTAAVHCPPAWTRLGITPRKVQLILGLDQAMARQRLLQASALWSDEVWCCTALGQDCPAGTTQRRARIMIPLPTDALQVVQQVRSGGTLPAIPAAATTRAPQPAAAPEGAAPAGAASPQLQDQGSAACFNPDLFKPGTHYLQHEVVRAPDGGVAQHFIRDNTVEKVSGKSSATGEVIVRGTFAADLGSQARNPVASAYSVEQTAAGPVYYPTGPSRGMRQPGSAASPLQKQILSIRPPAVFGYFALQPGQSPRSCRVRSS